MGTQARTDMLHMWGCSAWRVPVGFLQPQHHYSQWMNHQGRLFKKHENCSGQALTQAHIDYGATVSKEPCQVVLCRAPGEVLAEDGAAALRGAGIHIGCRAVGLLGLLGGGCSISVRLALLACRLCSRVAKSQMWANTQASGAAVVPPPYQGMLESCC